MSNFSLHDFSPESFRSKVLGLRGLKTWKTFPEYVESWLLGSKSSLGTSWCKRQALIITFRDKHASLRQVSSVGTPKKSKVFKRSKEPAWNANVKRNTKKSWIAKFGNFFWSPLVLPWPHSLQESHRTSTRNQEGIAHESYRWQIVSERSSDDRDLDEAKELRKSVRFDQMTQTLYVLFVCAWLLGTLAHLTMQARISNMILIWYHIISTDAMACLLDLQCPTSKRQAMPSFMTTYATHTVFRAPVLELPHNMPGRKTAPFNPLPKALCTKRSAASLLST